TRSKRDWSSDVCSSDLEPVDGHRAGVGDDESVDHARERGLTAAVDADDADAALGERQIDVGEDGPVTVGVRDASEADLGAAGVRHARRGAGMRPGRALCTWVATIAVTTALNRSPGRNTPFAAAAAPSVRSVRSSMPSMPNM